ncbi:MAG TPA: bifunctional phosphoribosyl-AMP cyclohydrolase/phosphoribosyl-ATP diphosphatase HisIE, partial [Thermoanaerobaculia bacterium]|nr:bifunctional phosphoribosyl-AMP cyclohydrolase/phosphoribosyl-ATP diphosphatase HisIE [Thermoanaerobaculia bacterium]
EGADEVAFLDIAAPVEARGTLIELVRRVANVLSIPFTVGGGVRSVDDADALLRAGADRVTVNTSAVNDPSLLSRLSAQFGAQCVVLAVDGKRVRDDEGRVQMMVTTHGGRQVTKRTVTAWAAEAAAAGAGEILLTSVDADGTKEGFDLEMLRAVRGVVDVPIVASGGAGDVDDFARAVLIGGADAVLAASVFHDKVFSIGEAKAAMKRAGLGVRPVPPRATPLQPRFDANGLVPVVVRDVVTGDVLTLAWANAEALEKTRETGLSHFYSRSRQALWKKGETSGHVQHVVAISLDCDRDTVLYDVRPVGPACHTGARTCFTRLDEVDPGADTGGRLDLTELFAAVVDRRLNPVEGSYTNELLAAGPARIAQKVGEEAVETALAAVGGTDEALAGEAADLLYHLAVLLTARGVGPKDVAAVLERRRGAPRRGRR